MKQTYNIVVQLDAAIASRLTTCVEPPDLKERVTMKSIAVNGVTGLLIVWLVAHLSQGHFTARLMRNREHQLSVIAKDVQNLRESLELDSQEPATLGDLRNLSEILLLEGQIRDLNTKDMVELSQNKVVPILGIFLFACLGYIYSQISSINKKLNMLGISDKQDA